MTWRQVSGTEPKSRTREQAKSLRKSLTPSEQLLWRALRHRLPLAGTHFRRQVAIGPYIADFCCLTHRLIIEADGEQHGFDDQRRHDGRRTAYLEEQGFVVLRFWNNEITRDIASVLDTILATLNRGHPQP